MTESSHAEYIMPAARLDTQAGIKIVVVGTHTLTVDYHHPYGRKQEEITVPLDESGVDTPGPITSWQKRWGNNGNSGRDLFFSPKSPADDDCSHSLGYSLPSKEKLLQT